MAAGRSGTTTICRKIAKPRGKTLFGPIMLSTIACLAGRSPPVPAAPFSLSPRRKQHCQPARLRRLCCAAVPRGARRPSPYHRRSVLVDWPCKRRESALGQCDPAHRRGRSRRHCGAAPSRGWSRSRPHRNRENGPWCGQSASDSCTILRANCVNQCHARKRVCVKQCRCRSVPKHVCESPNSGTDIRIATE
jgi:hypothetical protein